MFLEVKTRTGLEYGYPLESIDRLKISRIRKSAKSYMVDKHFMSLNPHFNVISVIIDRKVAIKEFKDITNFMKTISYDILENNKNIKIDCIEDAF